MAASGGSDATSNFAAVIKIWHVAAGLYFWEFLTTLDHEWNVIRGHRPYRWTIWIYSLMRVATLMAVLLSIIHFDSKFMGACQILAIAVCSSNFVVIFTAELLIVLRIIAIWNKQRVIMAGAIGIWVVNLVVFTQAMFRFILAHACLPPNIRSRDSQLVFIMNVTTNFVLLFTMFIGLLRLRIEAGGRLSLGRFLWKQGIIWFFIATIVNVPQIVFLGLGLNGPLSVIFSVPGLISLSIAAARMHRCLVDFVHGSTDISQSNFRGSWLPVATAVRAPTPPISLDQTEVVVHTAYLPFSTSETSDGTYTGAVLHGPTELTSDEHLGSNAKTYVE